MTGYNNGSSREEFAQSTDVHAGSNSYAWDPIEGKQSITIRIRDQKKVDHSIVSSSSCRQYAISAEEQRSCRLSPESRARLPKFPCGNAKPERTDSQA